MPRMKPDMKAALPVAAYGAPRAACTLFAALAASLIYAWLFMKI